MKSGKQRKAEIQAKRNSAVEIPKRKRKETQLERSKSKQLTHDENLVFVNKEKLAPNNSYGEPVFVQRGYYLDVEFCCEDCGVQEVWTATQQKWWYEVAKGFAYSTATRCRNCRRKERERRNEARRVHLEGLERKRRSSGSVNPPQKPKMRRGS